jgi:hypothetical protein
VSNALGHFQCPYFEAHRWEVDPDKVPPGVHPWCPRCGAPGLLLFMSFEVDLDKLVDILCNDIEPEKPATS